MGKIENFEEEQEYRKKTKKGKRGKDDEENRSCDMFNHIIMHEYMCCICRRNVEFRGNGN